MADYSGDWTDYHLRQEAAAERAREREAREAENPMGVTYNIAAGGCTTDGGLPDLTPLIPLFPDTTVLEEPTKMDIWMIWVTDPHDPAGIVWLEEAWDDDSVSMNRTGWDDAVKKAYTEHGGANVRITKTSVDFDKVLAAFQPAEV